MTYLATQGAKKEGIWGLVKGTGKGVLGLVLRPTGGLIDLTSATFNAVQRCVCTVRKNESNGESCRKTKVGDYDVTQLRPPRFIGQPKVSSNALFLNASLISLTHSLSLRTRPTRQRVTLCFS